MKVYVQFAYDTETRKFYRGDMSAKRAADVIVTSAGNGEWLAEGEDGETTFKLSEPAGQLSNVALRAVAELEGTGKAGYER